ncbi:hypothetical protein LXL04_034186 [Taraxacum kok-saghyz]
MQVKPTSIGSSKLRRSGSSGVPGGTPFDLRHYTNMYVGQASFDNSLGYPRDAPTTVLFGEWFRFGKPSDRYPHNVALTTYFRLMVSSPKTRIRFTSTSLPCYVLFDEWFRFEKSSDQYPYNDALTTYFRSMNLVKPITTKTFKKKLPTAVKKSNPDL